MMLPSVRKYMFRLLLEINDSSLYFALRLFCFFFKYMRVYDTWLCSYSGKALSYDLDNEIFPQLGKLKWSNFINHLPLFQLSISCILIYPMKHDLVLLRNFLLILLFFYYHSLVFTDFSLINKTDWRQEPTSNELTRSITLYALTEYHKSIRFQHTKN